MPKNHLPNEQSTGLFTLETIGLAKKIDKRNATLRAAFWTAAALSGFFLLVSAFGFVISLAPDNEGVVGHFGILILMFLVFGTLSYFGARNVSKLGTGSSMYDMSKLAHQLQEKTSAQLETFLMDWEHHSQRMNSLQSQVKYCEQGLGELVFSVPGADLNKLYVWTSDGTEGWLKDAVAELDDRTHVTKVKEIDSSETSANYGYRNGEYGVVGTSTRFNTFESTELHGFAYVTVDGPHLTRGIVRFESPGNAFEFSNLINRLSKEYDENAQELQSETARFKSLAHDEAANDPRISQKDVILSELGKFYRNHWKYLFGWKIDSFLEIIES